MWPDLHTFQHVSPSHFYNSGSALEKTFSSSSVSSFLCCAVKECDRLCLVTYDTGVTLEFGLTSITKANKEKTQLLIKSIKDGSDTNLCGGLMEGEVQHVQMYTTE